MYLKNTNKKIEIFEYTSFIDRFKSLKFVIDKIDYGIKLPNRKIINTYFFCQRVDLCITNKDDIIIYLYKDLKSEKFFIKFKSYNVYFFPLGTCNNLAIGDTLKINKK